ncbi:hypothetical protein CFP56_026467 [Quercus suber]|uniref:Uncharacterized protein n=1 Tax=Quercus suber TaxID=58331 RepID=A0AAW0LWS3_QUESU
MTQMHQFAVSNRIPTTDNEAEGLWVWVPNKKNSPAHIFRDMYHEQIALMLPGQIEGYVRLLTHHPVGMKDHKDITDVLEVMHEIGRVQPPNSEASNVEVATPAVVATQRPSTTESPSTSTAPARHCSCPPVATPQVVPTPDPSPSTPHPSLRPTIPSPIPHPPPSPTIPSPTPHPSPNPTIPSPTPHSCPRSDVRPPTLRSFPKLSLIPSFDLGINPTPPAMQ